MTTKKLRPNLFTRQSEEQTRFFGPNQHRNEGAGIIRSEPEEKQLPDLFNTRREVSQDRLRPDLLGAAKENMREKARPSVDAERYQEHYRER